MSTLPSSNDGSLTLETRSPEETRRLAVALSPVLRPGDVISLSGDLGAGKTTFVQGLAAGMGIFEQVTSPTFILMKEYHGGRYPLMHLDVYRLQRAQEVIDLGYDEFLDPSYVVVVEWGDVIEPMLPDEHLLVQITQTEDESVRIISLVPRGVRWSERMATVSMLSSELFSAGRDDDPRLKTGAFRVEEQKPQDEN